MISKVVLIDEILRFESDRLKHTGVEIDQHLKTAFSTRLSRRTLSRIHKRKNRGVFLDRCDWAKAEMTRTGLHKVVGGVSVPRVYRITSRGLAALRTRVGRRHPRMDRLRSIPPRRNQPRSGVLPNKPTAPDREMTLRDAADVEAIRRAATRPMRRLHNKMTNALRTLFPARIREGKPPDAFFDALLPAYDAAGHDLLIEVKASTNVADIRLGIGQLLDCRRSVPRPRETHLAILLPHRPSAYVEEFMNHLRVDLPDRNVQLLWFADRTLTQMATSKGSFGSV